METDSPTRSFKNVVLARDVFRVLLKNCINGELCVRLGRVVLYLAKETKNQS
jgi:hypothetical protein